MATTADRLSAGDRTPDQIREHYEIEKALAARLRNSTWEERKGLYTSLYDELYRRVPHHPQLMRKVAASRQNAVAKQTALLRPFIERHATYLEIGPGDCALSLHLTQHVKQVYAVDVSDEITKAAATPENFTLFLSDGRSIPVPAGSVDVAFSNQLMEHLHPDDALEQLRQIYRALAPGGAYVCITPNRRTGPHDISKHFDRVATGFHLKEYTPGELRRLFRAVGFATVYQIASFKGRHFRCPDVFLPALARTTGIKVVGVK